MYHAYSLQTAWNLIYNCCFKWSWENWNTAWWCSIYWTDKTKTTALIMLSLIITIVHQYLVFEFAELFMKKNNNVTVRFDFSVCGCFKGMNDRHTFWNPKDFVSSVLGPFIFKKTIKYNWKGMLFSGGFEVLRFIYLNTFSIWFLLNSNQCFILLSHIWNCVSRRNDQLNVICGNDPLVGNSNVVKCTGGTMPSIITCQQCVWCQLTFVKVVETCL